MQTSNKLKDDFSFLPNANKYPNAYFCSFCIVRIAALRMRCMNGRLFHKRVLPFEYTSVSPDRYRQTQHSARNVSTPNLIKCENLKSEN